LRISDAGIAAQIGARRQFRFRDLALAHDVEHLDIAGDEVVGNDAAMAAPPYSFRAHESGALVGCERDQTVKIGLELRCERIIGVVVKAAIVPKGIGVGGYVVLLVAPAAEIRPMAVANVVLGKSVRQRVDIELGIGSRPGKRANVHDGINPCRTEHGDKCLKTLVGVADSEDSGTRFAHAFVSASSLCAAT